MTQEEKDLLIKDLCARLPYEVKVTYNISGNHFGTISKICEYKTNYNIFKVEDGYNVSGYSIKPYLRPLSSMTEEEKNELKVITKGAIQTIGLEDIVVTTDKGFDWLNAHHFDYRRLIEKGLALEAPEGMYKIKKRLDMTQEEKQLGNEHNEHELTADEVRAWNRGYEKGYNVGYANGKNAYLEDEEGDKGKNTQIALKGWVARDKSGEISLYRLEPNRSTKADVWDALLCDTLLIDRTSFPDLTWEDEPLKVVVQLVKDE